MTRLPLLRSAILASVLCLVSAGTSAGGPILLDQSFTPDGVNDFSEGFRCLGSLDGSSFFCGQSFTVGLSGILTAAELYLLGAGGTPVVGLYDISGPLTLLESSSTAVAVPSPGSYSFGFSTPVTVGNRLALFVELPDEGDEISFTGERDGYAAGEVVFASEGVVTPGFPLNDLYFRTYVDVNPTGVPEPASSLLLLGLGLAGVAAGRVAPKITRI